MSRRTTLFIAPPTRRENLANVAATVFRLLGLTETEERDSSNYPPDDYFAGYAANATATICSDRKPEYPFHVTLSEPTTWRKGTGHIKTTQAEVATLLAAGGLSVFIPVGPWPRADWDGRGETYPA
jgi:hypothetical protein